MAKRTKSGMKAHRQNVKRRARNRELRSRLRTGLKTIRKALDARDPAAAREALKRLQSLMDRMASKGIIHRNAAARYKSRIAARAAAS